MTVKVKAIATTTITSSNVNPPFFVLKTRNLISVAATQVVKLCA